MLATRVTASKMRRRSHLARLIWLSLDVAGGSMSAGDIPGCWATIRWFTTWLSASSRWSAWMSFSSSGSGSSWPPSRCSLVRCADPHDMVCNVGSNTIGSILPGGTERAQRMLAVTAQQQRRCMDVSHPWAVQCPVAHTCRSKVGWAISVGCRSRAAMCEASPLGGSLWMSCLHRRLIAVLKTPAPARVAEHLHSA